MGNPEVDHAAAKLKAARDGAAADASVFVRPAARVRRRRWRR